MSLASMGRGPGALACQPPVLRPAARRELLAALAFVNHADCAGARRVCSLPATPQILRAFNVPTHPSKLKDAYRLAVRMYHPDSNSKEKVRGGGAP